MTAMLLVAFTIGFMLGALGLQYSLQSDLQRSPQELANKANVQGGANRPVPDVVLRSTHSGRLVLPGRGVRTCTVIPPCPPKKKYCRNRHYFSTP